MKRTYTIIIFLSLIFLASSQTVKELESQRKDVLQNLETMNKMLNETKKNQKSSLNKLGILNKNIKVRENLINNINTEINKLDRQVNQLGYEKNKLENRLSKLKKDYARLIQESYYNRNKYTKLMFILSAESFEQSYRRMRYLQEYAGFRKQQAIQIQKVTTEISNKTAELKNTKIAKAEVVKDKQSENKKLEQDKLKENSVYSDLKKKERKIRSDLKIQQKKANDLNNKIQQLIAEEIRRSEEAQRKKDQKNTANDNSGKSNTKTSSSVSVLTKEEALISGNFSANAGRLPWPTERGFISGHFGVQPHPVLTHVTTNNKGIYIQTPNGTNARAVFEGEVTQRFSIPGSNNAVIIKHGEYRTVYANLTSIYVKVGDKVSAKQSIGKIYTDDEKDNKTELYFQIWKGKTLLNPESWIAK